MYSGKIAVPPGGGGIVFFFLQYNFFDGTVQITQITLRMAFKRISGGIEKDTIFYYFGNMLVTYP
jgi:hypothetical protein